MKVYVLFPPVQHVRIQLNSRAYDVCERKFNGGSVGENVEKLHDLGRYSIKYRPKNVPESFCTARYQEFR